MNETEAIIMGASHQLGETDPEIIRNRLERQRKSNMDARIDGGTPASVGIPSFVLAREEIDVAPIVESSRIRVDE